MCDVLIKWGVHHSHLLTLTRITFTLTANVFPILAREGEMYQSCLTTVSLCSTNDAQ